MDTDLHTAGVHRPDKPSRLTKSGRSMRLAAPLALALAITCAPSTGALPGSRRAPARAAAASVPIGYVDGLCFGSRPTITISRLSDLVAGGNVVQGAAGDDVIVTRNGSYVIDSGGGSDKICAVGGNNTIDGGAGNSLIAASGTGANTIDARNSRCYVGSGHNVVHCKYVGKLGGATPGAPPPKLGGSPAPRPKPRPTAGPARTVPVGYANGLCFGSRPTITVSNPSSPIVNGTGGGDVIVTRNGSYTINAGRGNVKICAVGGDNVINGGAGRDLIWSSPGNNQINGGAGEEWIITGPGDDHINGGGGVSHCDAGAGDNVVHCTRAGPITSVPAP